MHPNPVFHTQTQQANLGFAREVGFGVLSIAQDGLPLMSHVPFTLDADGGAACLHLVRSNPMVRALQAPRPARIAVLGPHGYVSPDWYDLPDQVPTWNYVAVHLTGQLELRPDAELRAVLERQSEDFESRLAPKPVWRLEKMSNDQLERMMRQIVPCRFHVETVDGTWKLGQNKPEAARLNAASAMAAQGWADIAALMRFDQG